MSDGSAIVVSGLVMLGDSVVIPGAQRNSLLRISLGEFQEPIGHRDGSDGGPCETRDHGGQIVSLVEAVFEFGEIARDMFAVDGTVGSCDGRLDVAERCVDPFEGWRPSRLWS